MIQGSDPSDRDKLREGKWGWGRSHRPWEVTIRTWAATLKEVGVMAERGVIGLNMHKGFLWLLYDDYATEEQIGSTEVNWEMSAAIQQESVEFC